MDKVDDTMNTEATLADSGFWPAVAWRYFEEKKYARTVEYCRRMLESQPHMVSGRIVLARAYYHAGQFDDALEQFKEVLRRDPLHLVALKYIGDLYFQKGEEAAAAAYYRRVMELDPYCECVSSPWPREHTEKTHTLTLRRGEEKTERKIKPRLREPAFVTETVADIYRDQGYYQLAEEVYNRLLESGYSNRIAEKLQTVRQMRGIKDTSNEKTP